jgi:hypothetical protein
VVPTAGVTKDAQWTQGFITAAAMQASSGVIQNCRGVNLDGTSTNRKAMRAMEEEHPHMVNLVCATSACWRCITRRVWSSLCTIHKGKMICVERVLPQLEAEHVGMWLVHEWCAGARVALDLPYNRRSTGRSTASTCLTRKCRLTSAGSTVCDIAQQLSIPCKVSLAG